MDAFRYDDSSIHQRYAESRRLSEAALALWLDAIAEHLPADCVRTILDVGCGTGRFIKGLAHRFGAAVYGIDLSWKMLCVALQEVHCPRARLLRGSAERLPFRDGVADLVFLSMAYHHLQDRRRAAGEFRRVVTPDGSVTIRMATRQRLESYRWLHFFPSARPIEFGRTPAADEVIGVLGEAGFALAAHAVVQHPFAQNLTAYAETIALRGLSSLQQIAQEEFDAGVAELRDWCRRHDTGAPAVEEIDLLVFRPQ